MAKKTYTFKTEVSEILQLITHSVYSNKEIFLRELISNASDAIDKARIKSLTDTKYLWDDTEFKIVIDMDKENKCLMICDNGIWMNEEEVKENIWTIAKSGTKEFLNKLKEQKEKTDNNLIGQFWVWFYSVFMVANKVSLETKSADAKKSVKWVSDGSWNYSLEEWLRTERGTLIKIYLNKENEEFLEDFRVRSLIKKYSDYLPVPIQMLEPEMPEEKIADEKDKKDDKNDKEEKDKKDKPKKKERKYANVNETKSIWTRTKKEVKENEYKEFYRTVSMDFNEPLGWLHLNLEWIVNYKAILYIPGKVPHMMMQQNEDYGPKLYVQNVMILEQSKDLLPVWLRFIKWVVETNDLPLNVSRELLQDNIILTKIKTWLIKKILDKLAQINKDTPDQYDEFMTGFGKILKEWVYYDMENKERIAGILKFYSLNKQKSITIDDYIADKKEDQKEIFYITWWSRSEVINSPYLEIFKEKWIDVFIMTDPIDEWVVGSLQEYKKLKLKSIASWDLNLEEETKEKKAEKEKKQEEFKDFLEFVKKTLWEEKIEEVRLTNRLKDSVWVLVTKEGQMSPQMEKIMQSMHQHEHGSKRIFELNSDHPLIETMQSQYKSDDKSDKLKDLVIYTYEQALLSEWNVPEDMQWFIKRVNKFAGSFMK